MIPPLMLRFRLDTGLCTCCGYPLTYYPDGAETIGEGVVMCGMCVSSGHQNQENIRSILEGLVAP